MSDKETWFLAAVRNLYKVCIRNRDVEMLSSRSTEKGTHRALESQGLWVSRWREEPFLISVDF